MYSREKMGIDMKNRRKIMFLLSTISILFGSLLTAQEGHKEDPHYEWFEANEVAVCEDGIYTDSVKGMIKLNVVEYDQENDRYKVLCSCLKRRGLDPAEALSIPYEGVSE